MPTHNHPLHQFDLHSVVLFACLTLGGTSAIAAHAAGAAPLQRSSAPGLFLRADRDRNGVLSREEAQGLPGVATQFAVWDRNGDGQVSLTEFLDFAQPAAQPDDLPAA